MGLKIVSAHITHLISHIAGISSFEFIPGGSDGTAKPEGFCGEYARDHTLAGEAPPLYQKQFHQDQNRTELLRSPRGAGLLNFRPQPSGPDGMRNRGDRAVALAFCIRPGSPLVERSDTLTGQKTMWAKEPAGASITSGIAEGNASI